MKRTFSFIIVAVLAAAVMAMLPSAFGDEKTKPMNGKTLLEQKCQKCHKSTNFKDLASDRIGWVLALRRRQRGHLCHL